MDPQTRQEYIRAAILFLQNPKLVDSPLKDKLKFLQDKGLSEVEIDEALNQALVTRQQASGGRWNFLLILGLCFGGYRLYKAFVDSKTAGSKVSKTEQSCNTTKQPHDALETSPKSLDMSENPTLVEIMRKMTEIKRLIELHRTNFATDIQSLKTLLLGHEKFAAPPIIPAWQLKDLDRSDDKEVNADQSSPNGNKTKNEDDGELQTFTERTKNGHAHDTTPIAPV